MQTTCPNAKLSFAPTVSLGRSSKGACPDLVRTQWEGKPEFCPTLALVAALDAQLPGFAMRTAVQDVIDGGKIVKTARSTVLDIGMPKRKTAMPPEKNNGLSSYLS